mmetsp:Transcript_2503/g.6289  ORF Transcript_2503/g.6289 Transcript_2503/m.6289 type:complete len:304 (-) Transcript_2503:45-956(-)
MGERDDSGPSRIGIIGGSGVKVADAKPWRVETPYGDCLLSFLDEAKQLVFASRHHCTKVSVESDTAGYAPPHEVNYHALVWALVVEARCTRGIVAFGSTGSLDPVRVPIGAVVMPDDYYMVRPEPVSFWGNEKVGAFDVPSGGVGKIHLTPADVLNERWCGFTAEVQAILAPLYAKLSEKVKLAEGQSAQIWPCVHSIKPGTTADDSLVYVNTIGPRFETRAEIRAYAKVGHVVGMTCAREWALAEELQVPYCLVCVCDNACNGMSQHPGGALQEYLDHKTAIADVTGAIMHTLVKGLPELLA